MNDEQKQQQWFQNAESKRRVRSKRTDAFHMARARSERMDEQLKQEHIQNAETMARTISKRMDK